MQIIGNWFLIMSRLHLFACMCIVHSVLTAIQLKLDEFHFCAVAKIVLFIWSGIFNSNFKPELNGEKIKLNTITFKLCAYLYFHQLDHSFIVEVTTTLPLLLCPRKINIFWCCVSIKIEFGKAFWIKIRFTVIKRISFAIKNEINAFIISTSFSIRNSINTPSVQKSRLCIEINLKNESIIVK